MFCPECGVEYTDPNQEKCFACGAILKNVDKVEETKEEASAEASAEATESVTAAAPSATEAPAVAAEPVEAAAPVAASEGVNLEEADQTLVATKKKSVKKKILVVVAIVVAVLLLSGVAGFAFFRTQIKMIFMPASQVYSDIEAQNISNSVSSVVNLKPDAMKNVKSSTELSVDNISGKIFPVDLLSKLKDLKMVMNTEIDQATMTGNIDMSLMQGANELFKTVVSADQSKVGFNFPAMDTNFYTADFSKIRDYLIKSLATGQKPITQFCTMAGLTEQQFTDLMNLYGKEILINNINTAAVEYNKSTNEIEGTKYSNITVTYDGATMKKIIVALANKVKSDTVLKKALYTYVTNSQKQAAELAVAYGGQAPETISEVDFNKSIDDAMDMLASVPEDTFKDFTLKNTIFFDGSEKIVGRELEISVSGASPASGGSQSAKIMFSNVNKGGSDLQAMRLSYAGMTLLTFSNNTTGTKSIGSLSSSIAGMFGISVNYSLDKKDVQGVPVMLGNIIIKGNVSMPGSYGETPAEQKLEINIDSTEVTAGSDYLTTMTGTYEDGTDKSAIGISVKEKIAPFATDFKPQITTASTIDTSTLDMVKFQKDFEMKVIPKLDPLIKMFEDLAPKNPLSPLGESPVLTY